jgi:hypothetical protein
MKNPIQDWHKLLQSGDVMSLDKLLHKDVIFYSPLLFKPQKGKSITKMYLSSAFKMFENTGFEYVKEVVSDKEAILEFTATIDGTIVNGVDIISWDEQGLITEFKVMIRPFRAIEKVGVKMKEQLEKMSMLDKIKFAIKK